MARRINYLNNKDILKEIHKSKSAYCSFTAPEYSDYDIIVYSLADIPKLLLPNKYTKELPDGTKKRVTESPIAKVARADRLTKLAQDAQSVDGKKAKAELVAVDPESLTNQDIIFRVMTWDHIPIAAPVAPKTPKGKKAKVVALEEEDIITTEYDDEVPTIAPPGPIKYVKVNFPPFIHYKYNDQGELEIIGKSHWLGAVDTGVFSKDHGKITNKLALMYMKLCERYATRSNWRGYTYNDEMRSQALLQLSQIGLQFDEAKSQNPFAYYTAAITNSFTRVLNIEKRNQNIRDDILEMNNLAPSYSRQMNGGGSGEHSGDHYEE
jgi:hypothetical protein